MGVVLGFLEKLSEVVSSSNVVDGAEAAILSRHQGSLTMAGSASRVEPKVLIDTSLRTYEELEKVLKFAFYNFTGSYLNAANTLCTIDGVRVYDKLGQLNPNRDLSMLSRDDWRDIVTDHVAGYTISTEDYKYSLMPTKAAYSNEASAKALTEDMLAGSSIAIGKVVNVSFTINGNKVDFPVIIRLAPQYEDPVVLREIMAKEDIQDKTFSGRLDKAKSGEISWLGDFLLCKDLNEKKRVLAVKDKNGTYKEMAKRQDKNLLTAFITGKRSLAYASNIAVIDSDTLRTIEMRVKGKISNPAIKRAIFENTALMTIIVVDRGLNCVNVYNAGISQSGTYTIKQLESGLKNENEGLKEVLQAFIGQRPMSL